MDPWEQRLAEVKSRDGFPFAKFRSDEASHRACEQYWSRLFECVVRDQAVAWRPWQASDPDRDGNPMFTAIHLADRRVVTVAQGSRHEWPSGCVRFQPYLGLVPATFEHVEAKSDVLHLGVLCELSVTSERLCRDFWTWFCVDRLSVPELEARIRTYEASSGLKNP